MSITNRKIGRSDIHEVPQLLREMRLTSMAKELEKKLEDPTSNIFTVGEEFVDLALAEYNSRCTNKVNKYKEKTAGAWFPKMAVIENGIETAQSTTKAWINVLSDDGKEIRMYTRDPSLSSVVYHSEPHITFAKFPGEPYRYIGTFVRDHPRCTPTDVRFIRIATSFSRSDYL